LAYVRHAWIEGNIALADHQLLTLREEDMRRVRGNEFEKQSNKIKYFGKSRSAYAP